MELLKIPNPKQNPKIEKKKREIKYKEQTKYITR